MYRILDANNPRRIFISNNGTDTPGVSDGTAGKPFKTLGYALAYRAANFPAVPFEIILGTGFYTFTPAECAAFNAAANARGIFGDGRVELTTEGKILRNTGSNFELSNLIIYRTTVNYQQARECVFVSCTCPTIVGAQIAKSFFWGSLVTIFSSVVSKCSFIGSQFRTSNVNTINDSVFLNTFIADSNGSGIYNNCHFNNCTESAPTSNGAGCTRFPGTFTFGSVSFVGTTGDQTNRLKTAFYTLDYSYTQQTPGISGAALLYSASDGLHRGAGKPAKSLNAFQKWANHTGTAGSGGASIGTLPTNAGISIEGELAENQNGAPLSGDYNGATPPASLAAPDNFAHYEHVNPNLSGVGFLEIQTGAPANAPATLARYVQTLAPQDTGATAAYIISAIIDLRRDTALDPIILWGLMERQAGQIISLTNRDDAVTNAPLNPSPENLIKWGIATANVHKPRTSAGDPAGQGQPNRVTYAMRSCTRAQAAAFSGGTPTPNGARLFWLDYEEGGTKPHGLYGRINAPYVGSVEPEGPYRKNWLIHEFNVKPARYDIPADPFGSCVGNAEESFNAELSRPIIGQFIQLQIRIIEDNGQRDA